ncbi:MAG: hypothetical protein EA350_06935 [Gemmatimonadales bacterium]|nr:MAG: hypothetical protein EA350_06935 [Gemmatimonadales bacterium]
MNRFLDDDHVRAFSDPGPGAPMTPTELGEHAAHLVWETYSDFMNSEALRSLVASLGIRTVDGVPEERPAKELLIFHLWAHTRSIQLALGERGEAAAILRLALDELHRAVFEDLEAAGYPSVRLPLFEQRVGARYAEYYAAAEEADEKVGQAVLGHLLPQGPGIEGDAEEGAAAFSGNGQRDTGVEATILTHRAIEIARPFRDYLEQVVLKS